MCAIASQFKSSVDCRIGGYTTRLRLRDDKNYILTYLFAEGFLLQKGLKEISVDRATDLNRVLLIFSSFLSNFRMKENRTHSLTTQFPPLFGC